MTKQWLIRRAVLSPASRATTAPINSSVCRLPFQTASASPERTSATAFAAASWLWSASTIRNNDRSTPILAAAEETLALGPTRIGSTRPSFAASTAAPSAASSHGCATATFRGGNSRAAAISRRYFSCARPVL